MAQDLWMLGAHGVTMWQCEYARASLTLSTWPRVQWKGELEDQSTLEPVIGSQRLSQSLAVNT